MKNINTFETAHLIARKLDIENFELLQQMYQNYKVMATLGGLRSIEETQKYLVDNLNHWKQYGFGLWLLFDKNSQVFVGRGGLRKVTIEDNEEVEVAYALMPEYWHQGLATEIVKAFIEIAFEQLHFKKLVCFTLPSNRASLRVMEKTGFHYDKDIIHVNLLHKLYRLSIMDYWQHSIQFKPMDLKDLCLWQH